MLLHTLAHIDAKSHPFPASTPLIEIHCAYCSDEDQTADRTMYTHTGARTDTDTHTYTHKLTHRHMHTYTHKLTHTHTGAYTHTQTHTQTPPLLFVAWLSVIINRSGRQTIDMNCNINFFESLQVYMSIYRNFSLLPALRV